MRALSRTDQIALRVECTRFAQFVLGAEGNQGQYLDWIAFFERVQLDGPEALRGVYGVPPEPVVRLRIIENLT